VDFDPRRVTPRSFRLRDDLRRDLGERRLEQRGPDQRP
jgi:hypothetical protein